MNKVKLGEYIKSYAGGTPARDKEEYFKNGSIPWIKSGEVCRKYITSVEEKITSVAVDNSSAKYFPQNSVLVALYGATAGQVSISKIEGTSNQAVLSINGKKQFDNEYLYYLLTHSTSELLVKVQGSGQPNLSKQIIDELKVELKDIKEQKKIAEILTSVDKVIELTEIEIEKLKNLKKGMMQDLLTKGIGHTKFKDSPIGKIPESWEVKSLREVTSKVGSGKTPRGGSTVYQDKGIPLLRSQNIYFDGLRMKGLSYITDEVHLSMKNSSLETHDLLLNISGASIGRACVVPATMLPANINQHVCIIRFKQNREINSRYFKYCLESDLGQTQVLTTNSSGNREGLNFEQVRDFKFPVPEDMEIEKIVSSLDSIELILQDKHQKLFKIINLKKGLMQDLLTGKVRVKV